MHLYIGFAQGEAFELNRTRLKEESARLGQCAAAFVQLYLFFEIRRFIYPMKKYFRLFLALTMMVGLFTACGRENAAKSSEDQADKLNIVTTIFPEYDWVREILGTTQKMLM